MSRSSKGKGGTNNINNGSAQQMIAVLQAVSDVREMYLTF